MVQTRIFHSFASSFKQQQFRELKRQLLEKGEDCLLLGNFNICHYMDYDAIVVTPRDIFVVEFKESHQAGMITINDNGWTYADGTRVWSGNHADTPFEQMRLKRNWLYGRLRKRIEDWPLCIKTLVVFSEPFTLAKGETALRNVQEGTHSWLLFTTSECIANTLWSYASGFEKEDQRWYHALASYFGMKRQPVGVIKWWQRILVMLAYPIKILKKFLGKKYFSYVEQNPVLCLR